MLHVQEAQSKQFKSGENVRRTNYTLNEPALPTPSVNQETSGTWTEGNKVKARRMNTLVSCEKL